MYAEKQLRVRYDRTKAAKLEAQQEAQLHRAEMVGLMLHITQRHSDVDWSLM